MINIDAIKEQTSKILNDAMLDYQTMREKDKNEKAAALNPGENIGFASYNGFYSSDNRDKCGEILASHRAKIEKFIREIDTEIEKKASTPPTPEQTNLLMSLSIGKPSQEELETVLNANKDNYAMFSAINRIAVNNGYHCISNDSPIADLTSTKDYLTSRQSMLYAEKAETNLTPSFLQFAELMQ